MVVHVGATPLAYNGRWLARVEHRNLVELTRVEEDSCLKEQSESFFCYSEDCTLLAYWGLFCAQMRCEL